MNRAISISLRSFDESVRKGYLRLFPGDPDKSAELLNWRSHANPHGETKFAVATEGDEVVGMIALIATRLRTATAECLGYQAVDTAVDPAYRGQGIAGLLHDRLVDGLPPGAMSTIGPSALLANATREPSPEMVTFLL